MTAPTMLQISGLSKAFAVPVLRGIELSIGAGEVVALTGENGAGKSTLSKIMAGILAEDAGRMQLDGAAYAPRSRSDAEHLGVKMVLQELSLVATLSVAENLQLGKLPARAGIIDVAEMERVARQQLQRVGLHDVDPSEAVGELGLGQQQLVEIARGLSGRNTRVLILDEPTALLTGSETARLFGQIERLKSQRVSIVYISHRLAEIETLCDRVAVMRDGKIVADRPTAQFPADEIVAAMTGQQAERSADRPPRTVGKEALRLQGMSRGQVVRDVSLQVNEGEILGIAGLVGAGRTELLRLIVGADRRDAGEICVEGEAVEIDSPSSAVRHGIGFVPEDRKSQGLLLTQSVATNVVLADLKSVSRHGWMDRVKERIAVEHWLRQLRIKTHDSTQPVSELSGGNQQKVLLARWMHRECKVLLLDEPTRGVDVGARADIYEELGALAAAGKALLVVSSDLQELMHLCDRIAVLSAGRLVQAFERNEWSEDALLSAAFAAFRAQPSSAAAGMNA